MKHAPMNVRGVVAMFGGRTKLYKKLCKASIEMSHRTIDNWIYHGIIPMNRFIQLIKLAKANKLTLKLEDFINES